MHEFGLCEGILAAVLDRAGERRVSQVRIRAGVTLGVDEESMAQAFSILAGGTVAAGAEVGLTTVPAELRCRACGERAPARDMLAVCPHCASDDVEITGGDELILESIGYAAPAVT